MRSALRFFFLSASLRIACATSSLWKDSARQELDSAIEENEHVLAVFSSRTLEPIQPFHKILENLVKDQVGHTKIFLIDCDVETELCKTHDVNEYPAIRLSKGSPLEGQARVTRRYRGPKTEHGIRSFLAKHENAIISAVISEAELARFKALDDVVFIAFLSAESQEAMEIFHSIAEEYHEEFVFGYTYDKKIAEKEGVTVPSIICYKNTDGDHKVLKGAFTSESVKDFLATAPKSIIGDFSERSVEAYMIVSELVSRTPSLS